MLEQVRKIVKERKYRRVIFHLPAGLMKYCWKLGELVEEPVFLADPCFGACDVPLHYLKKLEADAIFNFAHSKPSISYPDNVHFIEVQIDFVSDFVPDCRRVGLVYVIQYKKSAEKYAEKLRKAGKEVIWGKEPDFMATYEGQITGCDIGAARKIADEVDCFVVCADGLFHASAVASLGKKTYNWLGEEAKPPKYPVAKLFAAKKVGILVSIKPGQFNMELAKKMKEKLEKMGKEVVVVVGDTISREIENFEVDVWIVTACPRIAEDFHGIPAGIALQYLQ